MLFTFHETEMLQILQEVTKMTKPSIRDKISKDIDLRKGSDYVNQIFRENISHLLNNPHLFLPKSDRRGLFKKILLHRMVHDIEVWEGIGGQVTLTMTEFSYQFVKGRTDMVNILKEYAAELVGTEKGGNIIIRKYSTSYQKKKIIMEYAHISERYNVYSFEEADIS
ncbi:MAG: hypothetical protein HeimC2_35770 [Candidatus Heimdallarchaeota archaeon LC_2]|nr:MAG: hypothetical protein HeimC2_35770 [Candidatus Heimdallarchaeota archaeon LC_2]